MLATTRRLAQVGRTSNPSPTIEQLQKLPASTGAGLFIEHPKFEPLGAPPTLLHVSLPSSSVLNARTKALVAANGDMTQMTQRLKVLNLWSKPLLYNEVSSTKPLSLLLSHAKGFVNLEMSANDEWTVMNTDNIAGWYGPLELLSNLSSGVKVVAHEQGNLLLTGQSQIFTIQLDSEESISVNPGALIAYTGTPVQYHKLNTLELPSFGVWNTVKSYYNEALKKLESLQKTEAKTEAKEQEEGVPLKGTEVVEVKEPGVFDTVKEWVSTKASTFLLKNRFFYEIKGPATLIIQNDFQSISKTLTQKELTEIYKSLK